MSVNKTQRDVPWVSQNRDSHAQWRLWGLFLPTTNGCHGGELLFMKEGYHRAETEKLCRYVADTILAANNVVRCSINLIVPYPEVHHRSSISLTLVQMCLGTVGTQKVLRIFGDK